MSDLFSREILVGDPLSEVTRNERKILLGVSALGIVIVKTGLVPSKISALGIEFAQADQRALLIAIGAIVSYFLCAFLIYAISDFAAWRFKYGKARRVDFEDLKKIKTESITTIEYGPDGRRLEVEADERDKQLYLFHLEKRNDRLNRVALRISLLRAVFEFFLPIIVAISAIVTLWVQKP